MPHPVVEAIKAGTAPKAARLAVAKGLLPLPPEDLLVALSLLADEAEEETRVAVRQTLAAISPDILLPLAQRAETDRHALAFLCRSASDIAEPAIEAALLNGSTPDSAVIQFAVTTQNASLLETLTINQQRLIRTPQLLEAILSNPKRSPEAERRAREVKTEFFEKEFGRRQISGETAAGERKNPTQLPSVADLAPDLFDAPVAPPPAPKSPTKLSAVAPVAMIQQGKAPRPARLLVAQGKLPLAPEDMLFAQVLLTDDADAEIAAAAKSSIDAAEPGDHIRLIQNPETPEHVLRYLLLWEKLSVALGEAILIHPALSDDAVVAFAARSTNGSLLEAATINQQRLIRAPQIIENILANPARTFEAERRARETKTEFFEKELGASRIAEEQKARAAKFANIIEVPIADEAFEDEFNAVLAEFEADAGTSVSDEPPSEADADALFHLMLESVKADEGVDLALIAADAPDDQQANVRLSIYQQLARMSVKERIFAALKGGREARAILIRDSNRMISTAVVKNPRITDAEVEAVANIKGISEDVLRIIAMNRAWVTNYTIMHNLVRNARCPINFSMQFLNRLQNRDLQNLGKNKSVPDALRQAAARLVNKRRETGQG
jgi:hypothetical protein